MTFVVCWLWWHLLIFLSVFLTWPAFVWHCAVKVCPILVMFPKYIFLQFFCIEMCSCVDFQSYRVEILWKHSTTRWCVKYWVFYCMWYFLVLHLIVWPLHLQGTAFCMVWQCCMHGLYYLNLLCYYIAYNFYIIVLGWYTIHHDIYIIVPDNNQ